MAKRKSTIKKAPKKAARSGVPKATANIEDLGLTTAAPAPAAVIASMAVELRLGPMLKRVMSRMVSEARLGAMARLTMDVGGQEPVFPISLSGPPIDPEAGEGWNHYKERVINTLGPATEWLKKNAGLTCTPIHSCNALQARGLTSQIREALKHEGLRVIEFDPLVVATLMNDVVNDIELPLYKLRHSAVNDGSGVRVAVLDSGIDTKHPWLAVSDSVSTCGESIDVPGRHGTHVAGSIASRDPIYSGIAPGVTVINVKVLDSFGRGQATFVTRGIDEAMDRGADVLCLSVGFNHLPTWSDGGHGWSCPDGRCQLCMAIDNTVRLEDVTAVVAAGNEHNRCEFLRQNGSADKFDTEMSCPGQAREAISVAAITKQTFVTAPFSSRGPTAFGMSKPDLAAPGVNITSALVARRDASGNVATDLTRSDLSVSLSGTSMATPIVAGVVALIRQRRASTGQDVSSTAIQQELLGGGFRHLTNSPLEVGFGRLNIASL
jgi:serine protease AprX